MTGPSLSGPARDVVAGVVRRIADIDALGSRILATLYMACLRDADRGDGFVGDADLVVAVGPVGAESMRGRALALARAGLVTRCGTMDGNRYGLSSAGFDQVAGVLATAADAIAAQAGRWLEVAEASDPECPGCGCPMARFKDDGDPADVRQGWTCHGCGIDHDDEPGDDLVVELGPEVPRQLDLFGGAAPLPESAPERPRAVDDAKPERVAYVPGQLAIEWPAGAWKRCAVRPLVGETPAKAKPVHDAARDRNRDPRVERYRCARATGMSPALALSSARALAAPAGAGAYACAECGAYTVERVDVLCPACLAQAGDPEAVPLHLRQFLAAMGPGPCAGRSFDLPDAPANAYNLVGESCRRRGGAS